MTNNCNQNKILNENFEEIDLDELDKQIELQLEEAIQDLNFKKEEIYKINNPESLGKAIGDVICNEINNQIAILAGEDFIDENAALMQKFDPSLKRDDCRLDLRKEAHFQTAENFDRNNIAKHNTYINYTQRKAEYDADFETDPNRPVKMSKNMRYNEENKTYERYDKDKKEWVGKTRYNQETQKWENYNPRNGKWEKLLDKDARKTFDTRTSKQKGSKSVHKDHVISAAEQIRDTDAAVHISREERQDFAKKDVNLQDLDSHINQSKGDLSTNDWYNHKRKDGSTQKEHFKMSDEEVNRLKDNDKKARSEYEKEKENGRRKSYEAGKKSQKQEALRITDKAARSAVMILLSDLLRKIVNKLIAWFRLHKKTLDSLLNSLKEVFYEFLGSLKRELLNTGEAVATTIASSIWGSIVNTINKIFIMFKQSWQSLKEAIAYLRNPDNKQKSFEIKMLEVGKIIIAGITASGSIALSEVFEKLLDDIPGFNVQIPLLGSLSNILGIFLGALVAGIIGAIAINKIHKTVAKKQNKEAISNSIDQENKVLALQHKAQAVSEEKFYNTKNNKMSNMSERHNVATEIMKNSFSNIMKDITKDPFSKNNQDIIIDEEDVCTNKKIDDINSELDDLLSQL